MKGRLARTLLIGVPAILILIQLRPVDRTNPPVTREIRWDSPATAELARRACYDCHSNETVWPWYSSVAPMKWLVAKHVREARDNLNFSTWDRPNDEADEIIEEVEDGEMPLAMYLPLHAEARLTAAEKEAFIRGVRATLLADPPVGEEGDAWKGEPEPDGGEGGGPSQSARG